jgi:hypothetical protein
MRLPGRLIALVLVASPLALAGCKQGVGDRCQVMSDCADGLLCVLPAGGSAQSGGVCQSTATVDSGVPSSDLLPAIDLLSDMPQG